MAFRLDIDDLSVTLGDIERKFTLQTGRWSIEAGEVIGLTGASGTGKTLLLELLGLLRAPTSGAYRAVPMDKAAGASQVFSDFWASPQALALCAAARSRFFGYVPQSGGLLPFLSVLENVQLSQEIAERLDKGLLQALLDELDLADIAHLRPAALSIGQRQRVAIARALAHRPFCVIADEPTAALDPDNAQTAMRLLIDAARDGGCATLLSSHDAVTLSQFAMRRMVLTITSGPDAAHIVSAVCPQAEQQHDLALEEVPV